MSSNFPSQLPKQQESGLDSTALFLSLYLVLLAFFILLNAISQRDGKKTGEVVSSVNIAFHANNDEQNFIIKKSVEVPVGDSIPLGGYFATLGEIMAKEVDLISMDNSQGNVMQVVFSTDAFFPAKKSYILSKKQQFMVDLAKNLQKGVSVEVVLTTADYGNSNLTISRLMAFTTRLESLGVKDTDLRIGVVSSSVEQLQLRFMVQLDEANNGK